MKTIYYSKCERQAIFSALVNKDNITPLLNTDIEYFTDYIATKTYNWIYEYKKLNKEERIGVPYIITDSDLTKKEADLLVDPGMYNGDYNELLENIKNSWPDPIPFRDYNLKTLPINIFPPWLKDHIISISEFTQTPVDMSILLVLSALSTALSKVALVEVKDGFIESLNIWTCTILPSANRKSAVFKHIINPILQYEELLGEQVEPEMRHAIEEKNILEDRLSNLKLKLKKSKPHQKQINDVYKLSDKIAEMNTPSIPRIVTDDITPEKISELMAKNNGRISILSPEGDLFKLMAGRYSKNGSANLDVYKKGWTGNEQVRVDRIGRKSIFVENPAITIGITVQPIMLEDLTQKKSFKGEGVLGRFIYAVPDSPVGNRKTGTEVPCLNKLAAERYNKGLNAILNLLPLNIGKSTNFKPHILEFSSQALFTLYSFEAEIENKLKDSGSLSEITDWGGKLFGQIIRVCGLLHIADYIDAVNGVMNNDVWIRKISNKTVENAIILGNALITHAKKVYNIIDENVEISYAKYVLKKNN